MRRFWCGRYGNLPYNQRKQSVIAFWTASGNEWNYIMCVSNNGDTSVSTIYSVRLPKWSVSLSQSLEQLGESPAASMAVKATYLKHSSRFSSMHNPEKGACANRVTHTFVR
jgi:hypothetical protein